MAFLFLALFSFSLHASEFPTCLENYLKTESLEAILSCKDLDQKYISSQIKSEKGSFFERFGQAYQDIDVACALNEETKYEAACEKLLDQIQDIHYKTFEQVTNPIDTLAWQMQDIEDFVKGKKKPVLGEQATTDPKAIFNLSGDHPLAKGGVGPIALKNIKLEVLIGCLKYLNSPDGILGGVLKSLEPFIQSVMISEELDKDTRGLAFYSLKTFYENPLDMDKHMWLMMNAPMESDLECGE